MLHRAGFTPRQLRADELSVDELRQGAARLTGLVEAYAPQFVAVVGISAYRGAFDRGRATIGEQDERIAGARLRVLPNPSGLNAHYQLPDLTAAFHALRLAVVAGLSSPP